MLDEHIADLVDAVIEALAPGDEEARRVVRKLARGFDDALHDLLDETEK